MSDIDKIGDSLYACLINLEEALNLAEAAKFEDSDLISLREALATLVKIIDKHDKNWRVKTRRKLSVKRIVLKHE